MSTLIEPFFYCLLASMIWAPIIFIAATHIADDEKSAPGVNSLASHVWPAALILTALPVLIAPIAAALGLSLRAPAPLPPMAEIATPLMVETELAAMPVYEASTTASLADILRAAAVIYFYSFIMLFLLAAVRHIWFAYRLNYAIAVDEPKLIEALEYWRARIGVTRRPRYVFSHIVSSVCVYGVFRPIVVMPYNLLDRISIEDAALMGAHEMAHVKRGDVALFALCSVAKAVFWFNPFMHRICARANLAAEQGADALVLARGVDRRQYAHCFVQGLRLAADAKNGFAGELIPSFTPFDKRSRRERLDAILTGAPEKPLLTFASKLGLGASATIAAGLAFAQAAFAVSPPEAREALPVAPVKGEITLGYGAKASNLGPNRPAHEGVDIRAARGAPVLASGEGKVIDATDRYHDNESWGKVVVIDHGHGLLTRYAHLDSYVVHKGDHVDAGDVIGAVGSTGKVTGPHLHFEVIADGETIDPTPVIATVPPATAAPKARETRSHHVQLAPLDEYRIELNGNEAPAVELDKKKARRLERKMAKLEERLRKQFNKLDAFKDLEGMTIKFNDLELEGVKDADELAKMLDGQTLRLEDLNGMEIVLPDMTRLLADAQLSEEEMDALRDQREDAMDRAAEAMELVQEKLALAEEARRDAEEDLREQEREHAQDEEERQRDMEQAKRDHEKAVRDITRTVERERAKAERELERSRDRGASEEEILASREEAIRDAKEDLERELQEIEQRRKELQEAAESAKPH